MHSNEMEVSFSLTFILAINSNNMIGIFFICEITIRETKYLYNVFCLSPGHGSGGKGVGVGLILIFQNKSILVLDE